MQDMLTALQPIFAKVFEREDLIISKETSAKDIPRWDSLHHVMLISEIEATYDIRFDLDELMSMQNVGDIIQLIESKRP